MTNDIRALVMDFDGVLTDNKVIVSEDGKESVMCSRDDGYALERIKELGISTLILSREKNNVVLERGKKLKTEVISGSRDKLAVLKEWCVANSILPLNLAYIGNDIPDLECLRYANYSFCPSDAFKSIKSEVTFILERKGGEGCIREIFENYIVK